MRGNALFLTPPLAEKPLSWLFTNPAYAVRVNGLRDILKISDRLSNTPQLSGYLTLDYEFGLLLEECLKKKLVPSKQSFGWLYEFGENDVHRIDSREIQFPADIGGEHYRISKIELRDDFSSFSEKINRLKQFIGEGDTYQINLTTEANFVMKGDVVYFIRDLLINQSAGYIAIINQDDRLILSISPELFFKIENGIIVTAPMKGTIKRGSNIEEDKRQIEKLLSSPKERAENLMIVDLLRNDIGKVCEYGSVGVDKLFKIETLETVHQMVSYISGKLNQGVQFADIIRALFPCGSVTGAPKIAAMEIIHELEKRKRGIYTGTIMLFMNNMVTANVAIRTIELEQRGDTSLYDGKLPVGSGVVWDSEPAAEYQEIKKKAEFLTTKSNNFYLFETILRDSTEFTMLELHLERLRRSAEFLLFRFDRGKILKALNEVAVTGEKFIVKLILEKWGHLRIEVREWRPQEEQLRVKPVYGKVTADNRYLYFKTSNRAIYEEEFSKAKSEGFDECIFINESGFVTEGSRNNVFYSMDGKLYTPPLSDGLLPGVLREEMLSNKTCSERSISLAEGKNVKEWFIGNSVYGLRKITIIL